MSARQRRRKQRHARVKRWEPEATPAIDAVRLRCVDSEDPNNGNCLLCLDAIQLYRFRWLCPTCRQDHIATVCFNCSHILDFGTDHGEPHRVDLVAAADDYFIAAQASESGQTLDEVRHESVAVDGPARHLKRLPHIDVTAPARALEALQ